MNIPPGSTSGGAEPGKPGPGDQSPSMGATISRPGTPSSPELECSTCGRPALGVASSCLGAVSFAFCRECIERQAEPEGMFRFTLDSTGGEVAEWVRDLTTYVGGHYLSWEEWAKDKTPDPHAFDMPEEQAHGSTSEDSGE